MEPTIEDLLVELAEQLKSGELTLDAFEAQAQAMGIRQQDINQFLRDNDYE